MKSKFFIILILLSHLIADKTTKNYKYEDKIHSIVKEYFFNVDKRNVEGILKYLTSDLILHFGTEGVTSIKSEKEFHSIFNLWSSSKNGDYTNTRIDDIDIQGTHIIKNYTAVADVTYTRLDANGNDLRTERSLYHLVRGKAYYGKPLKFIWGVMTKWFRPWKIYMISNVAID